MKSPARPIDPGPVARHLVGRRLLSIERRGKWLLLGFEGGRELLVLLGMTGKLLLGSCPDENACHNRLVVRFSGGPDLLFNDVRKFGRVYHTREEIEKKLSALGPDPLSGEFGPGWLARRARGRTRRTKEFIRDHGTAPGMGNIYANEALFLARLHPFIPAKEVSEEGWSRLAGAIKTTLLEAIDAGGTTLGTTWSNFCDPAGTRGGYAQKLRVYGRDACPECGGELVRARMNPNDQTTFFCPSCQEV
jgi:formamidopyrimidine-DNA glycosylase